MTKAHLVHKIEPEWQHDLLVQCRQHDWNLHEKFAGREQKLLRFFEDKKYAFRSILQLRLVEWAQARWKLEEALMGLDTKLEPPPPFESVPLPVDRPPTEHDIARFYGTDEDEGA